MDSTLCKSQVQVKDCELTSAPIPLPVMNDYKSKKLSYQDAGVSIEKGNLLIDRLKTATASTHRKGVMTGLGGFGALFDLTSLDYKQPVLVSGSAHLIQPRSYTQGIG